jgi:putative restriction endonuclease
MQDIWYDVNQTAMPTVSTTFSEGLPKLRIHVQRERNQTLVSVAKRRFKEAHGRLFCEVCGFDFSDHYDTLGDGFIEAHHRVPLSESYDLVETSVEDLAMVCANCHRMLHRRKPWLSIEELKDFLNTN